MHQRGKVTYYNRSCWRTKRGLCRFNRVQFKNNLHSKLIVLILYII